MAVIFWLWTPVAVAEPSTRTAKFLPILLVGDKYYVDKLISIYLFFGNKSYSRLEALLRYVLVCLVRPIT